MPSFSIRTGNRSPTNCPAPSRSSRPRPTRTPPCSCIRAPPPILGDNTKSFFDKYGDAIFYGLLIFPIIGSALAGVLSYFRADKNTQRIRQLHRLLQLIKRARTVQSIEELERLQDEADVILGTAIQQAERGQLDESGIAIFALAIDQARAALSEQRTVLLLKPENVPGHRMLPAPPGADRTVAGRERVTALIPPTRSLGRDRVLAPLEDSIAVLCQTTRRSCGHLPGSRILR